MSSGGPFRPLFRVALASTLLAGASGCPYGSELEEPGRFVELGAGGGAGSFGAASSGNAPEPEIPGVVCDWKTALTKSCAISTCHGARSAWGGLDLVVDAGIVPRLKDVPVTLRNVTDCDPDPQVFDCAVVEPGCTPFVGAKLVDSSNPGASFLLTKLTASGCGNVMPLAPGNTVSAGWDDYRKACLESLVRGIAAMPLAP